MSDSWAEIILQSVSDIIFLTDHELRVRTINPAGERLLGVRASEIIGRRLGSEVGPLEPDDLAELERIATSDHRGKLRNVRLLSPALDARLFDVQVDRAPDAGLVIVFRDATERAAAEALARAEAERAGAAADVAAAANRAKSEFLATMSHELRTPLNAILGYIELLEIQLAGPLTDLQRRYLERLRNGSQLLLGLINDILDFARADAGRLTVARETCDLRADVDAAVTLLRPDASARGLRLVSHCGDDEPLTYRGDGQRVGQILANLLSNAVKFTNPGGEIEVTCGHASARADAEGRMLEGPFVYVRVRDTGIGMSAGHLATAFEPFMQADTGRTRSHGGAGLGLAISRRLARLMGGELAATSEVGTGSTFTLWLGASEAQDAVAAAAAELSRERHGRVAGLAVVGNHISHELNAIVHRYVRRLRELPIVPHTAALTDVDLEDHVASFLADIAQSLEIVEQTQGEPTTLLRDGSDVQRLIVERHGSLRHQFGWSESALQTEFEILYEELARVVEEVRAEGADTAGALELVARLIDYAEAVSRRAFRLAASTAPERKPPGAPEAMPGTPPPEEPPPAP